jgi:hypothetical protein
MVGIKLLHSRRADNAFDFLQASGTWNSVTAPLIVLVLIFNLYMYMTHAYKMQSA